MNRYILIISVFAMVAFGCQKEEVKPLEPYEAATKWAEMTCFIMKNTPANSPTYASRTAGYIGLTMYESVVPGFDEYQSIAEHLNGLENLPKPMPDKAYNWIQVMNAGQAAIIKGVYNQTSDENKLMIDSLEQAIHIQSRLENEDDEMANRSSAYGKLVADAIFEWSKTDGGHRAYLKNFDRDYVHPIHPGSWQPPLYAQSISHHPLHPYWGENRTFLKKNDSLELPDMIPYDTTESSAYYQQYLKVYEQDKKLTQEEKEIALWWGDDPADTFTPPGHSFYLATGIVKQKKPNLIKCAETYARVGMAVADAFINCWIWKYHFFSERPNTFIPKYIDVGWESFWPDPPFPAFPSGHAIQASAAATVLEDLYGKDFNFVDSSHVGRERDEIRDVDFKARTFTSFWDFAEETANSRFYGGIHTPQDNEVGLEEGRIIAGNVNSLPWKKSN